MGAKRLRVDVDAPRLTYMNMASGNQDDEGDRLITSEELAEELRVKVDTLRQWRHKKTGPAFTRVGRFVRYRRSDVDAYLEANRSTH